MVHLRQQSDGEFMAPRPAPVAEGQLDECPAGF